MRHQLTIRARVLCLLLFAATVSGQSAQQGAVLIRNVLVAEGEGRPLVLADVLIVGGKMSSVGKGFTAPAGAIVIDGRGNHLTLGADGQIRLTPIDSADATNQSQVRNAQGQAGSFTKGVPTTDAVMPPGSDSRDVGPHAAARRRGVGLNSNASAPQQTDNQGGDEDLASKVVDPTAPLKTITFQNKFSPSLWGLNDKQNEIDMQLAVPLQFLGHANILRVTIPYLTSAPSDGRGLSDVSIFDIMLFPKKWGTPVAGVVANIGVNKGPGVDTFAIGPALGVVFKNKKWTYGVFNQNIFSAESIATTQIQPILAYTVNKKISVAFGDQQFTYDWHKNRFVLVPVGFQFNYIAKFGKQPVRFLIGPQYNIKNEFGSRKWTITTGFALILR